MFIVGIIYGVTYHFIVMPLVGTDLIHCIIMGLGFGGINYLLAYSVIKKYYTIKENNNILRTKLKTDKLTGLLNRQSLDYDLREVNNNLNYSIIFLDIDNFRDFNNKFGHGIGDIVLKKVSQTIPNCIRPGDRVYRYGGEEIVILLQDCSKKSALKIAERIRLSISQINNSPYPPITVSLGIASNPEDGENIYQIIKASDKALLTAKKQGKNCTILAG